jgi:XTP/dITP diphosphohydrolase
MTDTGTLPKLLIATNNPGKVREYATLLAGLPLTLVGLADVGITVAVPEDGATFVENALIKARAYCALSRLPTLADDSGLEVDALGGAPGVYSARYAGEGASDATRYRKLLAELGDRPAEERAARFRCAIALVLPDGTEILTEGTCEGVIGQGPRGSNGFGYDPIFYMPALGRSMAELEPEVKDRVSHRGRAAMRLKPALRRLFT